MAADIYTKSFTDVARWTHACALIQVGPPADLVRLAGTFAPCPVDGGDLSYTPHHPQWAPQPMGGAPKNPKYQHGNWGARDCYKVSPQKSEGKRQQRRVPKRHHRSTQAEWVSAHEAGAEWVSAHEAGW